MKSLVEYIKEAAEDSEKMTQKSFSFNFSGFEGVEDFIKSLEGFDSVSIDENTINVIVSLDNDSEKAFELIQDYVQLRGKDTKRASDESYAQKLHKLENKLSDWRDFVDDLNFSDNEKEEEDEKEDEDTKKEEENDDKDSKNEDKDEE